MRKFLLFVTASLLFFVTAYAQSLSLSWDDGAITNGQTITVTGDTSGTVYAYLKCTNSNASTLSVKVKKKHISIVPGSENYFCWMNCYIPTVFVSTYYIDIQKDSTANDFSGDYKAHGNIGVSTVMYTFYDMSNVNDSACVIVNYDCSLGLSVPENSSVAKVDFSNAYPNPANSQTSFTYAIPDSEGNAHLVIRDMVGGVVSDIELTENNGSLKIETSKLSDGVYFYSLMLDGQPYMTKKLVIKH